MNKKSQIAFIKEQMRKQNYPTDLIDLKGEVDSSLTYSENWKRIKEMLNDRIGDYDSMKQEVEEGREEELKENGEISIVNEVTSIAVVGSRRSGKTALCFHILRNAEKPVFIYKYPKPELLEPLGYKVLNSLNELSKLQDAIVWIDEPQLFIKKYNKRNNDNLETILTLAGQRNLTLILSTSDTRFINRGLESYIDLWLVKDIELKLVKRGSIVKDIIDDNTLIDSDYFKLDKNEFLVYSRDYPELKGVMTFGLPDWWGEAYSKPFRNEDIKMKEKRDVIV